MLNIVLGKQNSIINTINRDTYLTTNISANNYTWIEINKEAFEHNIMLYRSIIGPAIYLAIVVKGNAYGHGILEIARLSQENIHINWLCTASLSEALFLRNHGITKPLLVLGIIDSNPLLAVEYDIDIVAYSLPMILQLNALGKSINKQIKVHVKIDTGLSRFGFLSSDKKTIEHITSLSFIKINGIWSHFSQSDNEDLQYTEYQLEQFSALLQEITHYGISIPLIHVSNSAAITSMPNSHFNFVRIGAALYGLQPSLSTVNRAKKLYSSFELKPVLSWKSTIIEIRTIPANSYIGYSNTYKTTHQTEIGIIPIGYFEGYDRRLSNKGTVVILSKTGSKAFYTAPVIGRICMNITMIDLSAIKEKIAIGDEVIMLGNYPTVYAHEIANCIGSFNPREITTRLNPMIERRII